LDYSLGAVYGDVVPLWTVPRDRQMNEITTTYHGAATPQVSVKSFAWSYSRLKNFESCPKRHHHVDILKDVKEEESEALTHGNTLHALAAKRLFAKIALPPGYDSLESWCKRIEGDGRGELLVEQKLAITKEFQPCKWFDKSAWFRGVADVLKIAGPVGLAIDWKTGKILEDGVQLALMSACVFAHHPAVQKLRTEFVWLAHDATTRVDFARDDMAKMWQGVWPRIEQLEQAHNTQSYPAKPGRLCRNWCPVKQCVHNGE
jgi:hypothetical protein